MPLSPAELAALQEIERGLTAQDELRRRRGSGWRSRAGAPLLAAWLILVIALIVAWAVWDNPAAAVLASTLLLLLPAAVLVHRTYVRGHVRR